MLMLVLVTFQAFIWVGVGLGKFFFDYVLKLSRHENTCSGCMLASGCLPVLMDTCKVVQI